MIGIVGPDEGYFLFLPPNYEEGILLPFDGETENNFVIQSDTIQFLAMARAFANASDKVGSGRTNYKSKHLQFI